jgi:hypothetical protein
MKKIKQGGRNENPIGKRPAPPPAPQRPAFLERDAEIAQKIAAIANRHGWDGINNSKLLDVFIEGELKELMQLRQERRDGIW